MMNSLKFPLESLYFLFYFVFEFQIKLLPIKNIFRRLSTQDYS